MWINGRSWFDWTVAELLDMVRHKKLVREGETALGDFSDPRALADAREGERQAYRAVGHMCLNLALPDQFSSMVERYRKLKGHGQEAESIEYEIGLHFANGRPDPDEAPSAKAAS
jgi:hypothetical protein